MLEVSEDDLDIDENLCYFYQGHPFTGIAREYTQEGVIVSETSYLNGTMHGTITLWYPSGQVNAVIDYRHNMAHGRFTEYHPNGRLAVEGENEYDVCLWRKRYNPYGMMTQDYDIQSSESALMVLRIARKSFSHGIGG